MPSTFAPDNLKAVRSLFLTHLDFHPGSTSYPSDLDPVEAGIVGNSAHIGGYHCGQDRVYRENGKIEDYSVVESSRDRNGLSYAASALDWGWWQTVVNGVTHNLRTYSLWVVAQCKNGTADSKHIREVIYSPDGKTVKRWDRLGKRTSGDSSHLYHTHESHFRDTEGIDKLPLYRRYLEEIGLIDVALDQNDVNRVASAVVKTLLDTELDSPLPELAGTGTAYRLGSTFSHIRLDTRREVDTARGDIANLSGRIDKVEEKLNQLLSTPPGSVVIEDEQLIRVLKAVFGSLDSE